MNQMARIEENAEATERQLLGDQRGKFPSGRADPEQSKPLGHGLEIRPGERIDVVMSGWHQILRRVRYPTGATVVAAPVGDVRGQRRSECDGSTHGTCQALRAIGLG